ncbi:hypothetical protein JW979_15435, partial [bacterium]|nr:hypothetical protein [candidate division CSSED10-310 bacterium]
DKNSAPEIKNVIHDALQKVTMIHQQRLNALKQRRKQGIKAVFARFLEQILEVGDSKRRKRKAQKVMKDLENGRISHARASQILHELNKRQEGGWFLRQWQSF